MERSLSVLLAVLVALFGASTTRAEWHRADSEHFVVYADQSAKSVVEFAEKMERYHAALAFFYPQREVTVSPSNRVTVFIVDDTRDVQKLYGENARNVAGFYIPRAGGSIAVVPTVRDQRGARVSWSEQVLLHEYAHHFMISTFGNAFPLWFGEGFAEFFSTADFPTDGSVGIGLPAEHRGYELALSTDVPASLLLDTQAYRAKNKGLGNDAFYGKAWLLYHYLTFDKDERRGQLTQYVRRLVAGETETQAASATFGDLAVLERELDRYMRNRRWSYLRVPADKLQFKPVTVARLSAGHAKMMPLIAQSSRGVDQKQAAELVEKVRAIAAEFPNDPAVLAALAEAEYDAGNDEGAIAAAGRALALDPTNINALIQRSYAYFRQAGQSGDEAAWKRARSSFIDANRVENDNPIPLIYYFRSYAEQGKRPPEVAIAGLERALQLAPYDTGLRMNVGMQQIRDKRHALARYTLTPLAMDPHQVKLAERVRTLLDKLPADGESADDALNAVEAEEAVDDTSDAG